MANDSKTKCEDSQLKAPLTVSGKKRWWEKLVEKVGTAIGEAADKR